MSKFFTAFSRVIAAIFALLLIIAIPVCLLAFDIGRVIFNEEAMTELVDEIVTESDLIPAALAWYSESRAEIRYASGVAEAWVGEPDIVDLIEFMTLTDWRVIRVETLPNEILSEWVVVTVAGTYDWLDSDDRVPQISWGLKSLIRRVDSEHGTKAITIAYEALPPCTEEQVTDFKTRLDAAPPGTKVLYNLCEFPDPWYEDQFSDYMDGLDDLVANIPQTFSLTDELENVEDTQGIGPEKIKSQLLLTRTLMNWALVIPIALLLLILICAVRSLKSFGLWWGIPITIGGFLTFLSTFTYRSLLTAYLSSGVLSEVPKLILKEAIGAIIRIFVEIFHPVLWQSIIILAVGVALLLVGLFAKKRPAAEHPAQEADDHSLPA